MHDVCVTCAKKCAVSFKSLKRGKVQPTKKFRQFLIRYKMNPQGMKNTDKNELVSPTPRGIISHRHLVPYFFISELINNLFTVFTSCLLRATKSP